MSKFSQIVHKLIKNFVLDNFAQNLWVNWDISVFWCERIMSDFGDEPGTTVNLESDDEDLFPAVGGAKAAPTTKPSAPVSQLWISQKTTL